MATKSVQLDTLNIFLIILSLIFACVFPFELFVLAYAILGPLHYVTEINWLEKKSFFSKNKFFAIFLVILTILIAIPYTLDLIPQTHELVLKNKILFALRNYSPNFMICAFLMALTMLFTRKWYVLLGISAAVFVLSIPLVDEFGFKMIIGGLLPSIFHVYFFTMLFMLYGAIKSSSKLGFTSVIIMLIVPVIIYYLPISHRGMEISDYFLNSFGSSGLGNLNFSLGWMLGLTGETSDYYLLSNTGSVMSVIGLKIQIFIAFAYTYHYLNWFSKTTVIGWHKVIDKKRLIVLVGIWLISIGFYMYNYYLGFIILLFLSYLHVIMEFPLNWVTIKEIGRAIIGKKASA